MWCTSLLFPEHVQRYKENRLRDFLQRRAEVPKIVEVGGREEKKI